MLEFALRQERIKYAKLLQGKESKPMNEVLAPMIEAENIDTTNAASRRV